MSAFLLPVVLAGFCFGVAFGLVRLGRWYLDERDRRCLADFRARLIVEDARQRAAEWRRQQSRQQVLPLDVDPVVCEVANG